MRIRLWLLLTAYVGLGLLPATTAAGPPTKEEVSPVGEQLVCGETVLTITAGVVVSRTHVHPLRSGRFRVISIETADRITVTDEEGTSYRLVGSARTNITTPDPDAEGGEIGFFHLKVNLIGADGRFGTVDFRIRTTRAGGETVQNRGSCEFVEE